MTRADPFHKPSLSSVRPFVLLTLTGIGLLSIGLAVHGLNRLSETSDEPFDPLTIAWGVIAAFIVEGDLENVPTSLAVARVLAPIVTVGVLLDVVLRASQSQLHSRRARNRRDHLVLLGPADRVAGHARADDGRRGSTLIHIGPGLKESRWNALRIDSDDYGTDTWIKRSGALAAQRVVIATGSDHQNLDALATLTAASSGDHDDGASRFGRRSIVVEIDDQATALRLAVRCAQELTASSAFVDVVCPAMAQAAIATRLLIERAGDPPRLAVIGDGPLLVPLARRLAQELAVRRSTDSLPTVWLVVPTASKAEFDQLLDLFDHASSKLVLHHYREVEDLVDECPDSMAVLVDFEHPDDTDRMAVDLAARRPGWSVHVGGIASDWPLAGLLSLDDSGLRVPGALLGIFATIARERHDRARMRATTESTKLPAWDDLATTKQIEETQLVMRSVHTLLTQGFRLVPFLDPASLRSAGRMRKELSSSVQATLAQDCGLSSPDTLPRDLRMSGLVLHDPRPDSP